MVVRAHHPAALTFPVPFRSCSLKKETMNHEQAQGEPAALVLVHLDGQLFVAFNGLRRVSPCSRKSPVTRAFSVAGL